MLFLHRPYFRSAISPRIISGIVKPFGLNCARPKVFINPLLRRYRRHSAFAVTELNFTEGERTVPVEVIFFTTTSDRSDRMNQASDWISF